MLNTKTLLASLILALGVQSTPLNVTTLEERQLPSGPLFGTTNLPQCADIKQVISFDYWLVSSACALTRLFPNKFKEIFTVVDTLGQGQEQSVDVTLYDFNSKKWVTRVTFDPVQAGATDRTGAAWWPGALDLAIMRSAAQGGHFPGIQGSGKWEYALEYRGLEYLTGIKGGAEYISGVKSSLMNIAKRANETPLLLATDDFKQPKNLQLGYVYPIISVGEDETFYLWNPVTGLVESWKADQIVDDTTAIGHFVDYVGWQ